MTKQKFKRKTSSAPMLTFFILVSMGLALGSYYLSSILNRTTDQPALLKQSTFLFSNTPEARNAEKKRLSIRSLPSETDLQVLSDSILSIIQSYYVDSNRVKNTLILETLVAALNHQGQLNQGLSAELKQAGQNWPDDTEVQENFGNDFSLVLRVKDQVYGWGIPSNLSYGALSEIYVQIAQILQRHEMRFTPLDRLEAPEKAPPTLINLFANTLSELDAHSALLSPDAYRELRQGTEGSFGGLGVLVGIRDQLLTVIKPLPKSPAQRSGIKSFDRIVGINGRFTFGFTLEELVEYMRGEPGTDVHLSLLRKDSSTPIQVHLKREIIQVDSIQTEEIVNNHGSFLRIQIENFASRTSREVFNAIRQFRTKHKGHLDGLILDLRSNPGGLLDQAVQVADLFLPSGVIVSTRGRREEIERAGSGIDELNFPIVTLIDGDSASASEIVAGALQDHGRSLIVGQPSFGKGSVQTIFELPGERALKITIARYFTPSGRSIQNVGIIPDIWLQPIYQKKSNENLLGSYRYKNERFLRNHLAEARDGKPLSLRIPAAKSYYLAPSLSEDEADLASNKESDVERHVALLILGKLKKTYQSSAADLAFRASHWLGLAGPELVNFCEQLNQTANDWLEKNHHVTWTDYRAKSGQKAGALSDGSDIKLVINSLTDQQGNPVGEAIIGHNYKFPFSVTNRNSRKVEKVSVFLRSEHPLFETREILIGSLLPGQTKSGDLDFQVTNSWEAGHLAVRVGVATDSWPVPTAVADHSILISSRKLALLVTSAKLTAENGGNLPETIESREKAQIQVTIKNSSTVEAQNIAVSVINLSGNQTKILGNTKTISSLKPGEQDTIEVAIEAAHILYTSQLNFGLQIESQSLKSPLKTHFNIKSLPNADISINKPPTMSH